MPKYKTYGLRKKEILIKFLKCLELMASTQLRQKTAKDKNKKNKQFLNILQEKNNFENLPSKFCPRLLKIKSICLDFLLTWSGAINFK